MVTFVPRKQSKKPRFFHKNIVFCPGGGAGKDVTMRKYKQSPYPLIKFLLFISTHQLKDVTGSTDVKFGAKDRKDAAFYYSFYLSSEDLISIDQSVQMYFTDFGFVKF